MNSLNYRIDDGKISGINASFYGYDQGNSLNGSVEILTEDLPEEKTYDNITPTEIEVIGRKKLADIAALDDDTPEQTE